MTDQSPKPRDEKEEKGTPRPRDEKQEKQHEKEEKDRDDPLNALIWGAIFVWAGLVFLADNLGLLAALRIRTTDLPGVPLIRVETWGLIFLGAGVIILLGVALRLASTTYRRPVAGDVILAVVFLGIGLGNLISWNVIWPLVLIALGVLVLVRGMRR